MQNKFTEFSLCDKKYVLALVIVNMVTLQIVKLLSSKIVHINDKSVKFSMMITVTVTNNSGYGTSSS